MAQGAVKKKAPKTSNAKKTNPLAPKRGQNRVIAPKKTSLIQRQKVIKKHSAGMAAMTEKNLAQKAGHLELLKGGKRDAKKNAEGGSSKTK